MEPVKRENEIMETSWSISPEKYFDTKFEYQERFFNEKFLGIQIQNKAEHISLDKKIDALAEQNKFEHTGLERRIDRNFQISMAVQGLVVAILGLLVTLHFVR
jgi:hypothetical protein